MEINLYIVLNSEEDNELLKAGCEPKLNLDDCPLIEHTFYNIDFICPHIDTRYSIICSSGVEFLTKIEYGLLKAEISMQNRMFFLN